MAQKINNGKGRKYALLTEDMYNNLKDINQRARLMESSELRKTQSLDEKIQNVLQNKTMPEDKKALLYSNLISSYLNYRNRAPETMLQPHQVEQEQQQPIQPQVEPQPQELENQMQLQPQIQQQFEPQPQELENQQQQQEMAHPQDQLEVINPPIAIDKNQHEISIRDQQRRNLAHQIVESIRDKEDIIRWDRHSGQVFVDGHATHSTLTNV